MSQITRCPSCNTSFKVVADQLRISEGWVRCGQCKEVFDASAHLLAAAPPALLPDVSLTDIRPPLAPVARKVEAARSWGGLPSSPLAAPSVGARTEASDSAAFSLFPAPPSKAMGWSPEGEASVGAPVLAVPEPAVPAFLSATGIDTPSGEDLGLGRVGPFAWNPDAARNVTAIVGDGAEMRGGAAAAPPTVLSDAGADGPSRSPQANRAPIAQDPSPASWLGAGNGVSVPAGYELPFAALRDAEDMGSDPDPAVALTPMGYPALELPTKPKVPNQDAESGNGIPVAPFASGRAAEPPPLLGFAQQPAGPEPEPAELALVDADTPAAVLQEPPHKASPSGDGDDGLEVSFVVAARRKAFWRKPMVRGVLGALLLLSVAGLALQVAVQERDRLAAMDARTRLWLIALCAPLQCEIAPQRRISDVVIESSSFSKARGDSYQLALAMKNKASVPVAMPAVELTLTDAQDQPVLRRVLMPTDMGAPMELPVKGEWSASVSVIVTTGGARVAGYRLLAFYP
jgi:predicted Zn finger-like uncharacterized protein